MVRKFIWNATHEVVGQMLLKCRGMYRSILLGAPVKKPSRRCSDNPSLLFSFMFRKTLTTFVPTPLGLKWRELRCQAACAQSKVMVPHKTYINSGTVALAHHCTTALKIRTSTHKKHQVPCIAIVQAFTFTPLNFKGACSEIHHR